MFAEPLKETPPIVLAVCNIVATEAVVAKLELTALEELTANEAVVAKLELTALEELTANEAVVAKLELTANEADTAKLELTAFKTYEAVVAVPCKEPVNPAVAMTLPVTCTCEPDAKIRFDRSAPSPVPLPTINALCAEEERLY